MQKTKYPFELCHLYSGCSVNNCPLDPVYPNRYTDPKDRYKKCRCSKAERISIAEDFPELKYGGMTIQEKNE